MTEVISKIGLRHLRQGQPNQDYALWGQKGALLGAFLADGMSDSPRSGEGARIACESLKNLLLEQGERFFTLSPKEGAAWIADHVAQALRRAAAEGGTPWEDYSSTLSAMLLNRDTGRLLTVNLGDCLIGGVRGGKLTILAQPADSREGCWSTTSPRAREAMALGVMDAQGLERVFLCSDGAWRLMFQGGRLKPELPEKLRQEGAVTGFLEQQSNLDDCTFLALNMDTWEE